MGPLLCHTKDFMQGLSPWGKMYMHLFLYAPHPPALSLTMTEVHTPNTPLPPVPATPSLNKEPAHITKKEALQMQFEALQMQFRTVRNEHENIKERISASLNDLATMQQQLNSLQSQVQQPGTPEQDEKIQDKTQGKGVQARAQEDRQTAASGRSAPEKSANEKVAPEKVTADENDVHNDQGCEQA